MTSPSSVERAALADLLTRLGPDAPTLCKGWATRDLAAHLVLRERRPDAAGGVLARHLPVLKPVADYGEKVRKEMAGKPWPELVEMLREGPPSWNPLSIGKVDEAVNTTEFFVHHEDVRRAQTGWAPRPADASLERALWAQLRVRARLLYRKARVGVLLRTPTGLETRAHDGEPTVAVTGPVPELLLHAYGRKQHARVEVTGDPEAVRVFAGTPLGV